MNVLQMANDYLGSRLYENLFAALAETGVENMVYVPVNKNAQTKPVPENVTVSPCFSTLDRALFFRKQNKLIRDMEQRYDLSSMDIVHAHTLFSAGYAAMRLREKYGIPYIAAVRNTDVNVFFKYMVHLRKTGVEILRRADQVVFLSPVYRQKVLSDYVPQQYRQEIAGKSRVIPNGIAPLFFRHKAPAKTVEPGQVRLIYVGDINSNKNLELTIQAAQLLTQRGFTVTLNAVGTIKEEKYRTLMDEAAFVTHFDRCPQEQVLKHLEGADIFVMPSHTETFGLVYAEAMSQGLPVLYTRGEGFDGQFPEGTVGYAVSDTDPKELADKVQLVLSRYETLSANCVELVDRFRWDSIAQEYQLIYQRMKGE